MVDMDAINKIKGIMTSGSVVTITEEKRSLIENSKRTYRLCKLKSDKVENKETLVMQNQCILGLLRLLLKNENYEVSDKETKLNVDSVEKEKLENMQKRCIYQLVNEVDI